MFSLATPCAILHENKTGETPRWPLCDRCRTFFADLQGSPLKERSELWELRRKLVLNISVSVLSNFFILSGSKFQRETA